MNTQTKYIFSMLQMFIYHIDLLIQEIYKHTDVITHDHITVVTSQL